LSTYLKQKGIDLVISNAFTSKSSITKLAMIEDRGEPIEVPNFCLKNFPLKVKYVESKTKSRALKNFFFGIDVTFLKYFHLLATLSLVNSNETLNNETTSREIKTMST